MGGNFNSVMKAEKMHLGSRDLGETPRSWGVTAISFSVLRAGFCAMVTSGEHQMYVKEVLPPSHEDSNHKVLCVLH